MTWAIPNWWAFLLLVLAAYRTWRLLALDTITDPIRHRFVRAESKTEEFLQCPYCFGFWVTLAWWLAWVAWPHWSLVVATPFALSAVVALIGARLDPE
ncbi:MAG: DUF1360 domain-containing protein [Gemmatimonadota bacterium]